MQQLFLLESEQAFVVWDCHYIPLCYKYDLSVLMEAILSMCEELVADEVGKTVVYWGSDTFSAEWHLDWNRQENVISIHPHWGQVQSCHEDLKRARNDLKLDLDEFVSEWRSLLVHIHKCLTHAGFQTHQIEDIGRLEKILVSTLGEGKFYSLIRS